MLRAREVREPYETAPIDFINKKRTGQPIAPKARPATGNFVNLMDALRASIGQEQVSKPAKKPKEGDGPEGDAAADRRQEAKEATAKKTASKPQRTCEAIKARRFLAQSVGWAARAKTLQELNKLRSGSIRIRTIKSFF